MLSILGTVISSYLTTVSAYNQTVTTTTTHAPSMAKPTPSMVCVRNGIDGLDGMNGKDGKDGKDGKEGKQGKPGVCNCTLVQLQRAFSKPSIHLDGKTRKVQRIRAGKALDVWDYQIDTGHISGGMMYSKGILKVPLSGLYTIYSQIYYTSKTYSGRHVIRINNQTVALSEARGLMVAGSAITLGGFHVNKDDEISVAVVYDAEIFTGKWHTFFGAHLI
ncbi:uncharacterized protein LOC116300165 isoform X1 [Actinia tenebrosa]|uniref:Uncharacterized protein LOC116300165 isoform X1 n=1 Tax=Actinia tenebrosa TaxID=6105 RepID=A0A6P8IE22_ACTTE|nr:uncharacterized protein LOC116300165 isoform X1 [Actinia tenebrosa]